MSFTKAKVNQWIIIALSLMAFAYVVNRLSEFNQWDNILIRINSNSWTFLTMVAVQLFLLTLNQTLESWKWHLLINTIHRQSFKQSLTQTLGGSTLGAITPARLGEPAGRLYGIPKGKKLKAMVLGFLGGAVLTMVISFFGLISITIDNPFKNQTSSVSAILPALLILLIAAGFIIWFRFIGNESLRNQYRKFRDSFNLITSKQLNNIFVITIFRYFCFSFQLIAWIIFFDPEISISSLLAPVGLYYLIITIIPAFFLADLGIRGSVAVFIFSLLNISVGAIVTVIFCQWITTVCLPAVIGIGIHFRQSRNNNQII